MEVYRPSRLIPRAASLMSGALRAVRKKLPPSACPCG
jgi:hypothetical protein